MTTFGIPERQKFVKKDVFPIQAFIYNLNESVFDWP